jgi:uncharacterized protein
MKCPIDTAVDLVMTDRQGIEIDYCPTCRGVWLDRGELDKIIERSAPQAPAPAPSPTVAMQAAAPTPVAAAPPPGLPDRRPRWDDDDDWDDDDRRRYSGSDGHGYKKKKRSSFLGEIFDF